MPDNFLLWIVTIIYAGQAGVSVWQGQAPQAVIIGGYVVANLGLIGRCDNQK